VIITAQDTRLLAWAQSQLGVAFHADSFTLADVVDGELRAVVVYSNWTRCGCEMSIASTTPRWARRGFIRACFSYPFKQLGLVRVSFVMNENNAACIVLCKWLGAKQEGRLRQWYAGGYDAFVFGLLEEELPEWVFEKQPSMPVGIPVGPHRPVELSEAAHG
jgi:RimJ/RimL family protein N-acetyltransferase